MRLANAVVDLSSCLCVPFVQFEGNKDLEAALKKVKVENKNIFECCDGKRWLFDYIQNQDKVAFEAKKESERAEFEMLEKKKRKTERCWNC